MDPIVNGDPDPEPTISQALLHRLMHLFTPRQLGLLVEHGETVMCEGRYGQIVVTVKNGAVDTIGHQVSDKA